MTLMFLLIYFILQDKGMTAKQVASAKEKPFPFIIVEGNIDSPAEIHLAAENQLLCSFSGSLVEAACGLLASYYVFMFNYPSGLKNLFLYLQKCILNVHDGQKLPGSVITLVNEIDNMLKE